MIDKYIRGVNINVAPILTRALNLKDLILLLSARFNRIKTGTAMKICISTFCELSGNNVSAFFRMVNWLKRSAAHGNRESYCSLKLRYCQEFRE